MSEANEKPDNGLVQSLVSPDGVQGIKAEPQSRDVSPAGVLEVLETIRLQCVDIRDGWFGIIRDMEEKQLFSYAASALLSIRGRVVAYNEVIELCDRLKDKQEQSREVGNERPPPG